MASQGWKDAIDARLRAEHGGLTGVGRRAIALVNPTPYPVAMSSLGYQTVYRLLNALPDTVAERAFLPEGADAPLCTYESRRPVSDLAVLAFSVAYELELGGLFECLRRAGVPPLAAERGPRHPWVVVGGPLSYADPRPLAPFADVVVLGEAEAQLAPLVDQLFAGGERAATLRALAERGFWVPALAPEPPPLAVAPADALPARAAIWTPAATLADMFLVEAVRGCHRACTFCVMRRTPRAGMRVVPADAVLSAVPADAPKVGLVGAGVSDHPEIVTLVETLAGRGHAVGLSSLRADRLSDPLLAALVAGGLETLTVALDGASERLRDAIAKQIHAAHLWRAAERLAGTAVRQVKVYVMVGLPGETDADLDELVETARRARALLARSQRLILAVSPFVPKRNTPLGDAPFAGLEAIEPRLARLRARLGPGITLRAASARWAWVEAAIASGGESAGRAALAAWQAGGRFSDYRRALAPLAAPPGRGTLGRR